MNKSIFSHALRGVLVGAVTAVVIFFFKIFASLLTDVSHWAYSKFSILTILLVLAGAAALMWAIGEGIKEARGGGIPYSEAAIQDEMPIRPIRTIIGAVFGSAISFLCGVPVGSEGPSVLIGTSLGKILSGKKHPIDGMTGGAAAGFAVATGAPLASIVFSLEELHKSFNTALLVAASSAVIVADFLNELLSKLFNVSSSLFIFPEIKSFGLTDTWRLLVLGILVALAVAVFDFSHNKIKLPFPRFAKVFFVFILTGVLAYTFKDAIFSGHETVLDMLENNKTVGFLALLLVARLLMMVLIGNAGVTGGAFIPTLAIGAVVGALCGKLLILLGLNPELFSAVVLLSMCAFLGSMMRAPITACVLFCELTGHFSGFFFGILVIFITDILTEALNQLPFYEKTVVKLINEK